MPLFISLYLEGHKPFIMNKYLVDPFKSDGLRDLGTNYFYYCRITIESNRRIHSFPDN